MGARREAEAIARGIRDAGGKALFVRTDVSVKADVKRLVDTVVERHGRLDIAFNNAGIDGVFSPFVDLRRWCLRLRDLPPALRPSTVGHWMTFFTMGS